MTPLSQYQRRVMREIRLSGMICREFIGDNDHWFLPSGKTINSRTISICIAKGHLIEGQSGLFEGDAQTFVPKPRVTSASESETIT